MLPIDAQEKRLFDAIDRRRTIAGIVERASGRKDGDENWDRARAFFGRLWDWDQVVFEATDHG